MASDDESGGGFDPTNRQNQSERRRIRQDYIHITNTLQDNQQDYVNPSDDGLTQKLQQVQHLFRNVKMTREAVHDAHALSLISQIGRQKAQNLHTELTVFKPVEFAQNVVNFVTGSEAGESNTINAAGWKTLGEGSQTFFKRSPAFRCLYGTFERGEVQCKVKAAKAPKDNSVGPKTSVKQIDKISETDQKEVTTEEVERILRCLKANYKICKGPVCLFEFVCHPTSFGQTIENLFHTAFLIKDGYVKIFLDDDKLPVIEPVRKVDKDNACSQQLYQKAISLNGQQWKDIMKIYGLKNRPEPMIDTRETARKKAAQKAAEAKKKHAHTQDNAQNHNGAGPSKKKK